ncbi:hypothetical protein D3C71_2138930 [compost metagenome]
MRTLRFEPMLVPIVDGNEGIPVDGLLLSRENPVHRRKQPFVPLDEGAIAIES